jgi:RNA polymerase sigma-70 factor, ECF subfamily
LRFHARVISDPFAVTTASVATKEDARAVKWDEAEWAALMRAGNAGDAAAYERFLRIVLPALRAFARGAVARTGPNVEAEDVVQETLIAIHLKRHTWIESEPIGPWMRAIVRHKLIDALRRRGRHVRISVEEIEDILPAEETARTDYSRHDLERHLHRLPARQRGVIQAIALDGRSIRETAGALKISEGAVRVALHRGVAALAAIMQQGVA